MKTIILDNYDSFTYNLYQYIAELGGNPEVYRNDEITLAQLKKMKPTHLIISPGPGTVLKKQDFGICGEAIKYFNGKIPVLGVCLGHQGLAYLYGGEITGAPTIMHGKTSMIKLEKADIFKGLPLDIQAMRYHSLIVDHKNLPSTLRIIAIEPQENIIMGLQYAGHNTFGIQFHPESIGTPEGKEMLKNFLKLKHGKC